MATLDDHLRRLESLTRRPERGWSLIPLQQQMDAAHRLVASLRSALASREPGPARAPDP